MFDSFIHKCLLLVRVLSLGSFLMGNIIYFYEKLKEMLDLLKSFNENDWIGETWLIN